MKTSMKNSHVDFGFILSFSSFSLKIKQKRQQDFQCNYIHEPLYVEAVKGCHVNAVPKGAI